MDLKIVYEDEDVIVCDKPSGIATQTAKLGSMDMVSLLKNYLYKKEKKSAPYLAVIHRLDQPVEGLLVFAKTPFAAKELNRQLNSDRFGKYYMARLEGVPAEPRGHLEDYLVKDAKSNTSRVAGAGDKDAKKAVLDYEVLETYNLEEKEESLVKIQLGTGRHHQIRVQMANMRCPIHGDTKYNPAAGQKSGWQKIALCAYRLEFNHPRTKKQLTFEKKPEWAISI